LSNGISNFDVAIETWLDFQRIALAWVLVVVVLAFLDPCPLLGGGYVLIAHFLVVVDRTPIHFEFLLLFGDSNRRFLSVSNPSQRFCLFFFFFFFVLSSSGWRKIDNGRSFLELVLG